MIAPLEPAESTPSLDDPSLYYSRELSWLEFNDRVLEEASDPRNPLLERVKFTAIFSTNLDEYFMIRVAPLKQQIEAEVHKRSVDGRLPEEQLAAISARLRVSLDRFTHLMNDELWPALAREGIRVRRYDELDARMRAELERTFHERVFPVLTPLAVDQGHPFPYISNLSLSLGVEMEEMTPEGTVSHFARVKVPPSLPRFMPLESPGDEKQYVMLEQERIGATVLVRAQDGWSALILKDDDTLDMPEIGLAIPLVEFYEGLTFETHPVEDNDNDRPPPVTA